MIWRFAITEKHGLFDALGESVHRDILDLGFDQVRAVAVAQVYRVEGDLSETDAVRIGRELLCDAVIQDCEVMPDDRALPRSTQRDKIVEIALNPGVMDPVEASTLKGIRDLGLEASAVRTARQYRLQGAMSAADLDVIVDKVLANKLIAHVVKGRPAASLRIAARLQDAVRVQTVDLLNAGARQLTAISKDGQLFLNLDEMKEIQKHFRALDRNPTDCELETIAQTWSEHCHHKTFRGDIRFTLTDGGKTTTRVIRNLLKSTIAKATYALDKPWCVSVFHDNAGVIRFDSEFDVCFKVETHNHPSALEPYGGASTGVGGVIRDIMGTGLGARPVCNTDVFCFAPPDFPRERLPAGSLHPRRVMKGVVRGVRDYGNKMGIPTVNGAIAFDNDYVGNPLVYCGNVGILPRGMHTKKVSSGDLIVVVGGRTGRDGIHGATFSSGELTEESEVVSSGAVQIGDPIQEKKTLDVLMQARDEGLYSAVTDCGAGGLSSAVGEMGEKTGARVDLDKVPLKYDGLSYAEIWISESQERMVLSVPPSKIDRLLTVLAGENVEGTVIGEFTDTGRLELFYRGTQVCDLAMTMLHAGIPKMTKEARWSPPRHREPRPARSVNCTEALLEVLSDYNVSSKEWVIRQYDHEVQGGSVIKPLVGKTFDGPSDASVVLPRLDTTQGLAVANGINPRFSRIDPYWMAASCIDEAIRQIVAVGGRPDRIAILDNFCWGNPDKPDRLGGLVRAAQGCHDFAVGYGVPFISGKDSLYNEYKQGRKSIAIPGTLLISAIGIVDDVRRCVTMDLKQPGHALYLVGLTGAELGGSVYYAMRGAVGTSVPRVNIKRGQKIFQAMHTAIRRGLVSAAHDCSEGGLGVALAEMAFAGGYGVTARLDQVPVKGADADDVILFSESNTRFVVDVAPSKQKAFEKLFTGLPCACFGRVEDGPEFVVYGRKKEACVTAYIADLKEAWQRPLRW